MLEVILPTLVPHKYCSFHANISSCIVLLFRTVLVFPRAERMPEEQAYNVKAQESSMRFQSFGC